MRRPPILPCCRSRRTGVDDAGCRGRRPGVVLVYCGATVVNRLPRCRGRRGRWSRRLIFHFYPGVLYPGTTSSTLVSSTLMLGKKKKRNAPAPQLAGPVADAVRITPQFESFYTNPSQSTRH